MDTIAVRTPDLVGFFDMGTPLEQAKRAWLAKFVPPTSIGYERDINIYFDWCAAVGLDPLQARRKHLQVYVQWLDSRGWSRSTQNGRFSTVSSFYKICVLDEIVLRNPCEYVERAKVVKDEQRRPSLSPLALGIYLHAAEQVGTMEYALLALMGMRGLRIAEACALNVGHVQFHDGYLHVRGIGKGKKPFDLPLPARAADAVLAAMDDRGASEPVLLTKWRGRMTRNAAQRCIERVGRAAHRNDDVTPHALRRAYISAMLAAGAQLPDVQQAARHESPDTTLVYDVRQRTPNRDASHVLGGFLDGTRG